MTFEIVDGYIQTIYGIRNPEKLKQLNESVRNGVAGGDRKNQENISRF
jgi:hypothetical protein